MTSPFFRDPFDIAPQAQRPTAASWVVLIAGALFAGVCLWILIHSVQTLKRTRELRGATNALMRTQVENQRVAQLRSNHPALLEQVRGQQKLRQFLSMSWGGLFEVLEITAQTVRGGVSILALTPSRTQTDLSQVNITALAVNAPIMLAYIGGLQQDPRVRQVEILSQQPDDKIGPQVLRFQLSVVWDPRATMPLPVLERP